MQKLISKYGLAAHLALLAVAPLLVFPYLEIGESAKVVLWLSLLVFAWFLNAPSRINSERSTSEARRRISKTIAVDPTFWILVVVTIVAAVRALNNGISLQYDAESYLWSLTDPAIVVMPASSEGAGFPIFVSTFFASLIYVVVRHALGKFARVALGYLVGLLSGIAGMVILYEAVVGEETISNLVKCSVENPAFVGIGFGIVLVMMLSVVPQMFERRWNVAIATIPVALGGIIAALLAFSPAYMSLSYILASLVVIAYGVFWSFKKLGKTAALKVLVVFGVGFAVAAILVYGTKFGEIVEKFVALSSGFIPAAEADISARLTAVSMKVWKAKLWLGAGLGTFPLEFRFNATDADWAVVTVGQLSPLNGWSYLLVERGIVGALLLAVPAASMAYSYVKRIIIAVKEIPSPLVLAGPIVAVIAFSLNVFNASLFRIEALPLIVLAVALSTNSWAKEKIDGQ